MTSVDLQIASTFDMALTRQTLRKLLDERHWHPTLRIRSIAAITALAEILYFKCSNAQDPLNIHIEIINHQDRRGLEFHVEGCFHDVRLSNPVIKAQLERACDEIEVRQLVQGQHIVLRLWEGNVLS